MCPIKANPTVLPSSAPNCSSYSTTSVCMNTGYGVDADITPEWRGGWQGLSASRRSRCGFALSATWLKGVVYLQWNGSTLTENADLISKPCGMCMRHVNDGDGLHSRVRLVRTHPASLRRHCDALLLRLGFGAGHPSVGSRGTARRALSMSGR